MAYAPSPRTDIYTLVLVEDHATLRRFLREMFNEDPNLDVIGEADSAETALEVLVSLRPDLVTVDLSLPGMSGLDLVKTLKKTRPELRCLVVTGHTDPIYEKSAAKAGAVGFVIKDDPDEVLAAVHKAVAT